MLTLKNTMNPYDSEKASTMIAKKVVIPPLRMAGPISVRALAARSVLVPDKETISLI
jgi:hypothetical protein